MTKQSKNKPLRESNIELLRIILMLMIIGFHLIVHGADVGGMKGDYDVSNESSVAYLFLKCFLVIGVNCFVFISGFYRINFKVKPFLNLIFQSIFYSFLINLVVDMLTLEQVGPFDYLRALFPFFFSTWWFITAYLALYLLSPLLNIAVDHLTKNQLLFILIGLTVINIFSGLSGEASDIVGANQGFSLLNFFHIYLIGQYIRNYAHLDDLTKYSSKVYVGTSLTVFVLAFLSITQLNQLGIERLFAYNNPLVLIAAISFFFIFKSVHIKSKVINNISPYMLGVYLFHDHPLTREHLIENLFNLSQRNSALFHFLSLLLITLLVFVLGYLLDRIRNLVLSPMTEYFITRFRLERIERILSIRHQ